MSQLALERNYSYLFVLLSIGYYPDLSNWKPPMRYIPLYALLVALAPAKLSATTTLRVQEVGLQGYYGTEPIPTRIQLLVSNSRPEPHSVEVRIRVRDLKLDTRQENRFSFTVNLGPLEQRVFQVPVLLFLAREPVLEVEARNTTGRLLAEDRYPIEKLVPEHLLAIVCAEQAACQAVQTGIGFSGTPEEQTRKGKMLKFVSVREPATVWWAYAAARAVVLAQPAEELTAEQRLALEAYLRQGGRLVLVEDKVGDSSFLAPYRKGVPTGKPQAVGAGTLFRVPNASGVQLGGLFAAGMLESLSEGFVWRRYRNDELGWIRRRLATSFHFPRLRWLLGWLGAYILVVGFLNFTVLRRMGRREWGWATVPAISLTFALGLYAASVAERPRSFGVDELAVYWMDDRSSMSGIEAGVRVSSPRRITQTATVPSQLVFTGQAESLNFAAFSGVSSATAWSLRGWNVRLGPPWQVELPLLQWSFRDLQFRGIRRAPGTIRRTAGTHLQNDTGQAFREALYVDKEKVYFLGSVETGADIDLSVARQEPLSTHTGRSLSALSGYPDTLGAGQSMQRNGGDRDWKEAQKEREEWQQLPRRPFALVELVRAWPRDGGRVFESRSGVFLGLSEEQPLGASLASVAFQRKNHALTIVSFGREL